jgi:hypothetical protein
VSEAPEGPDLAIDVVRGEPTAEEVAALTAVLSAAYAEEAQRAPADTPVRSRWELSARGLRSPLARERGWTGFTG